MAITKTLKLTKYDVELDWGYEKEMLVGWGKDRQSAAADAMNKAGYGGGAIRALKSWDAKPAKE